jgi:hypothetical protein
MKIGSAQDMEKDMAALTYATVGSNRLDEAKRLYDELLGSVDLTVIFEPPSELLPLFGPPEIRVSGILPTAGW